MADFYEVVDALMEAGHLARVFLCGVQKLVDRILLETCADTRVY